MDSRQISQKQVVPESPAQASLSGDLNKTIGKSRNSQEIIAKPQQEVNKTPKKLFETPVQAPPPIGNWNRTFSSSTDSPEEIAKQQEKAYTIRYNKSVASLDALNNLKQVLQSPPVQAIPLPGAPPKVSTDYGYGWNNALEMENYYNPPNKQTIIINPNFPNSRNVANMKRKLELPPNQ